MDEVNISTGEIKRVLIIHEEYEEVLDLLKNKAVEIKFDPTVSRQKRKVKLKELQGFLSNARSHAKASREYSLNAEFKACSQILYDAAR